MEEFKVGTVTVKDGELGPWRISTFTLSRDDVLMMNLRYIRDGQNWMVCPPGTYRRLTHQARGVIMSNTPMEIYTSQEAIRDAKGRVLVNGLGLGMIVEAMLHKPEVLAIDVVEIEPQIIKLVGPHLRRLAKSLGKELTLIHGSAELHQPAAGVKYDFAWHDIWDQIDDDNLPQMTRLVRRYRPIAEKQGVWSRDQARALRRENQRYR
jgi:hypothetical protein